MYHINLCGCAELVDGLVSKTNAVMLKGSSPFSRNRVTEQTSYGMTTGAPR